jgi:hypothetical protein
MGSLVIEKDTECIYLDKVFERERDGLAFIFKSMHAGLSP